MNTKTAIDNLPPTYALIAAVIERARFDAQGKGLGLLKHEERKAAQEDAIQFLEEWRLETEPK